MKAISDTSDLELLDVVFSSSTSTRVSNLVIEVLRLRGDKRELQVRLDRALGKTVEVAIP